MAGMPAAIDAGTLNATADVARQSVRSNFAWTLAGNMVYAASQWGLLVILAKSGTPQQVGQFALALALTGPIFVLAQFHLRALQTADAGRFEFADYLGMRVASSGAAVVLSALVSVSLFQSIASIAMAVAVARAFDNLSDIFHGLLQQQERMARIGRSLMMKGPLSLLALAITLRLTGSVAWAAAGFAAASFIVFVTYDWGAARAAKPSWNVAVWQQLFRTTLPLTVVMMLIALNTALPRYILEHFRGTTEVGIFAALSYFPIAGNTVVTAAGQAIVPRLSQLYSAGDRTGFHRLWRRGALLVTASGVLGLAISLAAGEWIVSFFYRPEYANVLDVLYWVMAGSIPLYLASLTGYAITAARVFRPQVPLFSAATLATLFGCLALIPSYGIRGAALAFVLGALVQLTGSLLILSRVWSNKGV